MTLACCQLTPAEKLVYCIHYLQNMGSLVYKLKNQIKVNHGVRYSFIVFPTCCLPYEKFKATLI